MSFLIQFLLSFLKVLVLRVFESFCGFLKWIFCTLTRTKSLELCREESLYPVKHDFFDTFCNFPLFPCQFPSIGLLLDFASKCEFVLPGLCTLFINSYQLLVLVEFRGTLEFNTVFKFISKSLQLGFVVFQFSVLLFTSWIIVSF